MSKIHTAGTRYMVIIHNNYSDNNISVYKIDDFSTFSSIKISSSLLYLVLLPTVFFSKVTTIFSSSAAISSTIIFLRLLLFFFSHRLRKKSLCYTKICCFDLKISHDRSALLNSKQLSLRTSKYENA